MTQPGDMCKLIGQGKFLGVELPTKKIIVFLGGRGVGGLFLGG